MHFKLKLIAEGQKYAIHGSPMYYGVAVGNSPEGPFTYSHKYLAGGENGAGDVALFKDDDGIAYLFCAKKPGHLMGLFKLTDDYMNIEGDFTPLHEKAVKFEAPAVFKYNGLYHCFGSGTRGYHPTVSRYATSKSIKGPWKLHPGFARGSGYSNKNANITFGGQCTYVLPVQETKGCFIAMFDQWRPTHPFLASYMWLPVRFDKAGLAYVEWMDTWDLSVFDEEK